MELQHFQKFMKRLRKSIHPKRIKFFHCGEYGELNQRPHYHALLFGHDFDDKVLYKTHNDQRYYVSEKLNILWPFGFSIIGDVTFESAAYVARYQLKKITGKNSDQHYQRLNPETGEINQVAKEYATMSRRPGIGRDWYKKFQKDVYPSDFVIRDGIKMKPPKFYDKLHELDNASEMRRIKNLRVQNAMKHAADNTRVRLKTREQVQIKRVEQLKRNMDNDT